MNSSIDPQLQIVAGAVDQLDQGISVVDSELRLVLTNRRLAELLAFPPELVRPGTSFKEMFRYNAERGEYGPGDVEQQVAERVALAKQFQPHCFQRTRPDGHVVEVRGNPLPGGGFVTTYTDITERVRYEEALQKSRDELKEANLRLLEADRTKSNFLSSVSHELRTPLTSVLGFAKLISKDFANMFLPLVTGNEKLARRAQRVGQNLDIIIREGERLTRLINDVLDLAKIEAGRVEWRDSVVEIKDLVEHSVQAVTGQFAGIPDVTLEEHVAAGLPGVTVDRDRLTQVLINLLNNAAKFTRAGKVEVSADLNAKGQIQVCVRDTGPGIPAEFLDKVFEKFQQVTGDTLVDKPQGTGLGLPICREIVQHYGGRIWAESELGRGSAFFFTLPATQPRAQPAEPKSAPAPESRARPLILVVDDEPGICILLAQILEDDGYQVISATEGNAALELARARHPDLITMDLMMPGMDGHEAISHLRQDAALCRIPIVVVSAVGDDSRDDADVSLTKPVDETRFLHSVRRLLHRGSATGSRAMVLRGATTDPASIRLPMLDGAELEEVDEEAMWSRLEAGFAGTVIIAHGSLRGTSLERLAAYRDVQVVIAPETERFAEKVQGE